MLKKYLPGFLLLSAALAASALQAATLRDFEATYILKLGSLRIGTSTLTLQTETDGSYRYKTHSWPSRWVSWLLKDQLYETSRGRITPAGIRPDKYHYLRNGGDKKREAKLSFNWDEHSVSNHVEGSLWEMDIPAGTVDKLASQLSMMLALQQDKKDVTFNIADGGHLKEYRYKVVGHETLEVPAGTFETVKITKLRDNKKRVTYVWCAPALNYLPIRIWQRETDDSEYTSDLESFSETLRVVP
jgi:hypothetical protein